MGAILEKMCTLQDAYRAAVISACLLLAGGQAQALIIVDAADEPAHLALAAQPQYDPVGVVKRFGTIVDSSGILISPNWVLTAAHTIPSGAPTPTDTWTFGGEIRGIAQAIRNPNSDGQIANGFDVALHRLDSPITTIAPAPLYTGTAASLIDQTLTYVGYGKSGTGSTGDTIAAGTKRAGMNIAEQLGFVSGPNIYSDQLLFADMDAQGGGWGNPLGGPLRSNPVPLEILIALGDSGGGLFVEQGGQFFVAGVHSLLFDLNPTGTLGFGDMMATTTIEQSLAWILQTIAPPPIIGDLDGSGIVDILDLNIVLAEWNTNGNADPRADTDGNGLVDILDLNFVLTNWNNGSPPAIDGALNAVPEPNSILLIASAAGALMFRRR